MANKNIKGITVEIGGDTSKLGDALKSSEDKSKALKSELKEINSALKFNPGNIDLVSQKQELLTKEVEEATKALNILKSAEAQVQAQYERGDIGEEQYRAFKREVISAESKLSHYEKQLSSTTEELERLANETEGAGNDLDATSGDAKKASNSLDDLSKSADKAGDSSEGLGGKLGGALKAGFGALVAGATAVGGALIGSAEASREYRTDMGKLSTAFDTAGHSAESATTTYQVLQGILGESDQAVEASNHLAKLAKNEEDLTTWTTIATGVYAEFGDSLPIENLTEASNETAKTGQLTGGLADALNWAGVNEEKFQEQLDACSSEQERQALITSTLNGLYSESAEKYRETNAEVIRANEANESLASSMAEIGASVEPLLTDVKMLGASLLKDLLPNITGITDAFRALMNGEEGASESLGSALSNLISTLLNKLIELAPKISEIALSLISTFTTTLISNIPLILSTGIEIILGLLAGLTTAIPQIIGAITNMIPQMTTALVNGIPLIIQGAVTLLLAIADAIPQIIPPLVEAIPQIINALVNGLITALPQLLQGAITLLLAIVQAIPVIVQTLVPQIPTIVTAIVNALMDNLPLLLDGAVVLFMAMVEALFEVRKEILKAIPKLITAVVDLLKKLPGKLYDAIKPAIDKLSTWGANLKVKAESGIKNMVSAVITWAKTLPSKIASAISGAITAVVNWGSNMVSTASTAIKNVASSIANGLKGVPASIKTIGKNIIEGLWNGINDKVSWLTNKIKSFASNVTDKIKDFFGIHSPSRVMRDQVGKYISEGIGVGITDNADKPINSLKRLGDDMVNGATIGQQIETTFGQGGDNVAMLEVLKDIYKRLNNFNQSIVLDTGVLVGETINKIDSGLANNYTLKARGI